MSCFIICIAVVDLNQEEIISIDVDCWCYFCYYYQHLLLKRALFSPFLKHNEKQSKRLFKGHLWYKLFHTETDRQTDTISAAKWTSRRWKEPKRRRQRETTSLFRETPLAAGQKKPFPLTHSLTYQLLFYLSSWKLIIIITIIIIINSIFIG